MGWRFLALSPSHLSITGRECAAIVGSHAHPITPPSEMRCGACNNEGRAVAGEASDAMNARGVDGFEEGHIRGDSAEAADRDKQAVFAAGYRPESSSTLPARRTPSARCPRLRVSAGDAQ